MKAEQPRDLGGLKALIEVAKRQLAPEVIEDIAEIQSFRLQPAGKGPLAQAEAMGDRLCARFRMRQERRDGVFHNGSKRADIGAPRAQRVLAMLHHHLVQKRVVSASEGSSLISSE